MKQSDSAFKFKNREGLINPMFETVLDTLDGLAPQYASLYSKSDDGKFKLDDAVNKRIVEIGGLSSALDKERKLNKTAKEQLEAWQKLNLGATPEEVLAKVNELTEAATTGAEGKTNWDKMRADLEKGHTTALAAKDGEVAKMRTTLERHLIDKEAVTAIASAKGVPDLLLPHIQKQVKVFPDGDGYVVRVLDKEGDPRGDGKGGYMTIPDLVAELKASSTFGRAFEGTGNSGGGKPPNSSKSGADAGRGNANLSSIDKIARGLDSRRTG